jgi:hypothetical protein
MQMVYKGNVSYKNDDVNYVRVNPAVEAKIARLDPNIAQLSFVDNAGNDIAIPVGMLLVLQASGAPAARVGNVFFMTWVDNYVLLVNGVEMCRFENQKQQAIGGGVELDARIVQV